MFSIARIMNEPIVEQRVPAPYGHRPKEGTMLVMHRFPVKNGVSQRRAWVLLMSNPNPLFYMCAGEECPPQKWVLPNW